jgi:hypothetical protein
LTIAATEAARVCLHTDCEIVSLRVLLMLLVAALFVASTVAVGPDTAVAAEEPSDDNLDSFVNYWVLSNKLASLQQQVCHTTTVRVPTRMHLTSWNKHNQADSTMAT